MVTCVYCNRPPSLFLGYMLCYTDIPNRLAVLLAGVLSCLRMRLGWLVVYVCEVSYSQVCQGPRVWWWTCAGHLPGITNHHGSAR